MVLTHEVIREEVRIIKKLNSQGFRSPFKHSDVNLFDAEDVLVLTAECRDVVGVVSVSDWTLLRVLDAVGVVSLSDWTLLRLLDLSSVLPPGSDIFLGGRSSLKKTKNLIYGRLGSKSKNCLEGPFLLCLPEVEILVGAIRRCQLEQPPSQVTRGKYSLI